jgi:hypothetical protein
MGALVPGTDLVASALTTSAAFLTAFGPVLGVFAGLFLFVLVVGAVSSMRKG